MSSAQLAAQMENIILGRIAQDKLAVALMPALAHRVLVTLQDANLNLKRVVKLLEQDPVLAARVMRLASSAAYGSSPMRTLDAAVTRLGVQKLRTLLIELSARQLFISRDARIAKAMKELWDHSLAVALIARDLSALSGQDTEMDTAYVCGLFHDLGKPIVASVLLEAEKAVTTERGGGWIGSDFWLEVVNQAHRRVGIALAEKWMLPDEAVQAIKECSEYDSAHRHSPANFVRFANAVAKREGICPGTPDLEDADAIIMIGRSLLEVNDEIVGKLTASLRERIAAHGEG
ncbi:MAG TPA: HDOD domain-containing protein [Haliangiales bacterium]|nr:HDOD domain-containing protein [Haliangiales bacterium]